MQFFLVSLQFHVNEGDEVNLIFKKKILLCSCHQKVRQKSHKFVYQSQLLKLSFLLQSLDYFLVIAILLT